MKKLLLIFLVLFVVELRAQTNIHFSNPLAAQILAGTYNPADYSSSANSDPHAVVLEIEAAIRPDSLKSYLERMSLFETRNTGSDTLSSTRGIGAARTWAHQRFEAISAANNDRLVVSYLNWTKNICGQQNHKNVVAILPGSQIDREDTPCGIVIVEAHLDSRCDAGCDTGCVAQGMEDNGSGSALVLELARTMAKYQFNRTVVFMLTVAEEQGLVGAEAMAKYCEDNQIRVGAVLNNDVIGGVICGETSFHPRNRVKETSTALSEALGYGVITISHKQLSRYIKLQYEEELKEHVSVPMEVTIMTAEDREGRGGDHIPFREHDFNAIRFTSANEHGNANSGSASYHDRQHTSDDILGKDTNNDGNIDEWYVDFNYLARNASINATATVMIGRNVCTPEVFQVTQTTWKTLEFIIAGDWCSDTEALIAMRTETNDWDTLFTIPTGTHEIEIEPGHTYYISAAYQNNGVESLFTNEVMVDVVGQDELPTANSGIRLLQNRPNPFDEATVIAFMVYDMPKNPTATIRIQDLTGRTVKELPVQINSGINEVVYNHGYRKEGTFTYSLVIDGQVLDTKKMTFVAF
ncbi:MAG: M20/M25/M40 family metallo-hydrolase [Flavobacteriales bacterium]